MGHDRRVLDQALDAAQALGQREDPQRFEKAPRAGEVAVRSIERDHAAEAAVHLALGERVLRVARRPG